MSEEKDLIWVPKSMKKLIDELESDNAKLNLVEKWIEQRKLNIKSDIESLDDDLLMFKAFALKYKKELESVFDEQDKQLEDLWNKCNDSCRESINKINKVKDELRNVVSQVDSVKKTLDGISTYKIEQLLNLVERFNRMSQEEKGFFELLLKHSKEN